MAKVEITALNSANVTISNASDATRVYNISSRINIYGSSVNSFEEGKLEKEGTVVATFSLYGENNLTVTFIRTTPETQVEISAAINAFISDTRTLVESQQFAIK